MSKNELTGRSLIDSDMTDSGRFCCKVIKSVENLSVNCGVVSDKMERYLGKEYFVPAEIRELELTNFAGYCGALQLGSLDFLFNQGAIKHLPQVTVEGGLLVCPNLHRPISPSFFFFFCIIVC